MLLFQNSGMYPSYRRDFDRRYGVGQGFAQRRDTFLADRFGASHFLLPVLQGDPSAFFTNGDDEVLQRAWARENGLAGAGLEDILLAQIEHHRTEVFYTLDPATYDSRFLSRLPGCVRMTVAWRAAPSAGIDLSGFDLLLCNFDGILADYRRQGFNAAWFAPAHDPEMDVYARSQDRPVDVLFMGGYSRHHRRRAEVLEAVAGGLPGRRVVMHLDRSRLTRLAESPLGMLLPLARHRRPGNIRKCTSEPVFGMALYQALGKAKVVLNGAVDMAGEDRGNMRCFEAMGCGAAMVSDRGRYPPGMEEGNAFVGYTTPEEAISAINRLLNDPGARAGIVDFAGRMVRERYSKDVQWTRFQELIAGSAIKDPKGGE